MCDIRVCKWSLLLVVRWSKTIQDRNRTLPVPVPKIEHFRFCLYVAILNAFKLLGGHDFASLLSGPAFVYTYGNQVKPLTYIAFCNKLKNLLEQCGIDGFQYSEHSFGRGGTTFTMNCGVAGHYSSLLCW